MLYIDTDVVRGIMFIHLNGTLDNYTYKELEMELNYLLYKQGMHYFVFDFNDLDIFDFNLLSWFNNKLVEIFLSCGKVALWGLNKNYLSNIGSQDELFFINNGREAFNYLLG